MKPILYLLAGFIIFNSCTKKSVAPAPPAQQMSVNINDITWTALNISGSTIGGGLDIIGYGPGGSHFMIIIPSPTPGNYIVGVNNVSFSYVDANLHSYSATSGIVAVNSFSNLTINGSFVGECLLSGSSSKFIQIKNGIFTAKIE